MRVTYLHQYFNTPMMPGSTRSYEMARRLVRWGHTVDMITSDRVPGRTSGDWHVTDEDGIRVHWLPVPYANEMGTAARLRAFFSFAIRCANRAASVPSDVIFATSTPLTIALPALYARRRQHIPMVFEVRDLWPEAPIQMGVLKRKPTIAAARWLEDAAYRSAAHIVALTPGMRDGVVARGVPEDRVTVIPNSSDLDLFSPDVDGSAMRQRLRLGEKFVCAYFGTVGPANGLGFILDAAAVLKRRGIDNVVLVIHGRGRDRAVLEARATAEQLDNVVFSDPVPDKNDVARLAAAADVCLTIYKNLPVLYTCSPNKMFDAFAAGKPVLVNMPGWLQHLVEEHEAGVFVKPDDAEQFADKVVWLRDHPDTTAQYGRNARRLAETTFARDDLAKQLESILRRAVDDAATPGR